MDLFAAPLPTFNIRGQESVRTLCGSFLSIAIMYVTLIFAALKFMHLMQRHNPGVNAYVEYDAFNDLTYNTAESDFVMAVSVEDYVTGEVKQDPRFVKWFAELYRVEDGVSESKEFPMHICTDEDYAKFYPPDMKSADWLDRLKEKNGMMCFDWAGEGVELLNYETDPNYTYLDIMYLPCHEPLTKYGGAEDRIPDDCNFNRQDFMNYLGPLKMVVYHNQGAF